MSGIEDAALAPLTRWVRIALLVLLAWWTIQFARTPLSADAMDSFLHLPNLVFHEAGHIVFSPFGALMASLGGSLLQVLIPIVVAIAFIRQDNAFAAAVGFWWAGQNLIDLAPYIADARALRLVLLGGKTGAEVEGHDWEFILTRLGLVHRDQQIGLGAYWIGLIVMVASLAFGARAILRKSE